VYGNPKHRGRRDDNANKVTNMKTQNTEEREWQCKQSNKHAVPGILKYYPC
jgi:hypothetical protein